MNILGGRIQSCKGVVLTGEGKMKCQFNSLQLLQSENIQDFPIDDSLINNGGVDSGNPLDKPFKSCFYTGS